MFEFQSSKPLIKVFNFLLRTSQSKIAWVNQYISLWQTKLPMFHMSITDTYDTYRILSLNINIHLIFELLDELHSLLLEFLSALFLLFSDSFEELLLLFNEELESLCRIDDLSNFPTVLLFF
jgi:hypothetical protein